MATNEHYPTKQEDDFLTIIGNTFKLIGQSWQALVKNIAPLLLTIILPGLVIAGLFIGIIAMNGGFSGQEISSSNALVVFALLLAVMVFSVYATVAATLIELKGARGEKADASAVWNQAPTYMWRMLGLLVLTVLIVIAGMILLIVPGLLAIFFLSLATYVLVDKNTGVVEALKTSYEIVKSHWKVVLALFVVQAVISIFTRDFEIDNAAGGTLVIIGLALSIAYAFLPAIIYTRVTASGSPATKA